MKFQATMALVANDTITVQLPGFWVSQPSRKVFDKYDAVVEQVCTPTSIADFTSCYHDCSSKSPSSFGCYVRVVMRVVRAFFPEEYDIVTLLRQEAGITLPRAGVYPNVEPLLIGALAQEGSIPPMRIPNCPSIGSFIHSSLFFTPDLTQVPVEMEFTFKPYMRIGFGETVSLYLPGFNGRNFTDEQVACDPPELIVKCSWDISTRMLTFPVEQAIAPKSQVNLTISQERGLSLPEEGVIDNSPMINIETNAVRGVVVGATLSTVEGIASVSGLVKLDYSNPIALEKSQLILTFKVQFDLLPGDKFSLTLPGFSSNRRTPKVVGEVLEETDEEYERFEIQSNLEEWQ